MTPTAFSARLLLASLPLLAAGCSRSGQIDSSGGVTAVRSACPAVGVPVGAGDVTLFDPPASRDARAIDVVANITNVRSTCNDSGDQIATRVTFDVQARRAGTGAAREVVLPYFITVIQAGNQVASKQVSRVALRFEPGQDRATASGEGTATVSRAAVTLPDDIRRRLTERRRAGNEDAAIDPLSVPEIRTAVANASFEALVGFQLTDEQLRYNATR